MSRPVKIKTTVSPRWARFCGRLLRLIGWTAEIGPVPEKKGVIIGVPHTSAWDFLVCYLFYTSFGKVAHIMIKKEFFFWPIGPILRACGAVPVDRANGAAMVKSLISLMDSCEEFHLAIAVEGTRKRTSKWKTGYHLIARETGATVYAGYFDWGRKRISIGERWDIVDDPREDVKALKAHYSTMGLQGKHKDKFTTD